MMIIRPIQSSDYPALRALASCTGQGFTSLQDNDEQVKAKFESALAAFDNPNAQEEALYLFLLEDTETHQVVGVCGIEAAVGLSEPWYNYRLGTLMHASRDLNVKNKIQTLTISNDHTGYSELCTLFLRDDYRHSKNGSLLSKSRMMFMAEFPHRFNQHVIAEMRGYTDDQGNSPFWESLGRHFFSIDFSQADQLSSMDKVFIAELMPKHTIYTNLLGKEAQAAIGQTHSATTPARKLLESEGLRDTGYIDIFDGGVTLEARTNDIRAINQSHYIKVNINELKPSRDSEAECRPYLVSTTSFREFRCALLPLAQIDNDTLTIQDELAQALRVTNGELVRIVPLFANNNR